MDRQRLADAWLDAQLAAALEHTTLEWLRERLELASATDAARGLPLSLGWVPRRLPDRPLAATPTLVEAAATVCPGWRPIHWSVRDAARVRLAMRFATTLGPDAFGHWLADYLNTADLAETIALCRGLPLYPPSDALLDVAAESLRSNVPSRFEAIAHHSPFAFRHFDEARWNQMILKALFVGSPLEPIHGLDLRANIELADMLCDYARERTSAGRAVPPVLWRLVGPFARGRRLVMLIEAAESGARDEHLAAVRALLNGPDTTIRSHAARWPETLAAIEREYAPAAAPGPQVGVQADKAGRRAA